MKRYKKRGYLNKNKTNKVNNVFLNYLTKGGSEEAWNTVYIQGNHCTIPNIRQSEVERISWQ